MFRVYAKRTAAAAGGAALAGLSFQLSFPLLEDEYWYRKAPDRVAGAGKKGDDPHRGGIKKNRQKLVILGTGWASIAALDRLDRDEYDITIVSPRNAFLFTPLLPSTAVGTLSDGSIAQPIRSFTTYKSQSYLQRMKYMWRGYLPPKVHYAYASCRDIDPVGKQIHCKLVGEFGLKREFDLPYDKLLLCVGCNNNTWNTPGVDEHCHYLKESGDAMLIRQQLLENLEIASLPGTTEQERRRLLSFYVIGGGPTGVEFAAEMVDFLREDVSSERRSMYRGLAKYASNANVTIVQSGNKLLPGFAPAIQDFCEDHLRAGKKVNVLTNTRVTSVSSEKLELYDKQTKRTATVPYGLIMWSTGVAPTRIAKKLMAKLPKNLQTSKRGILTDTRCQVLGAPDVYAVGDCSNIDLRCEFLDHVRGMFEKSKYDKDDHRLTEDENEEFVKNLKASWADGIKKGNHYGWNIASKIIADFEERLNCEQKKREYYRGVDSLRRNLTRSITKFIVDESFHGLDEKTMEEVVSKHVSNQPVLPATAQVAQQQGWYAAEVLNKTSELTGEKADEVLKTVDPFNYVNRGQLVYAGAHVACCALPGTSDVDVTWNGTFTNIFWHAAYFDMNKSYTGKYQLLVDWFKVMAFGRSTAVPAICTDHAKEHAQALVRHTTKK